MRKMPLRIFIAVTLLGLLPGLFGCAMLKRKFTPKKKPKPKKQIYHKVHKYEVKPSLELYEKHYVFWINWHRKLVSELGKNAKNDSKCAQQIRGNVEDMAALLTDEKAAALAPHIDKLKGVEAIIAERNMTKTNETRVKHRLEREYRTIRREFSPRKMKDCIRSEWKGTDLYE